MSRGIRPVTSRCVLVAAVATAAAALLESWLVPHLVAALREIPTLGFPDALAAACEAAAAGSIGSLWVLVILVVRDALRGRATTARAPVAVRRLVLAACGLSLAGGLLAPAHAARPEPPQASPAQLLVGLAVPDRMSTAQWLGAVTRRMRAVPVREGRDAEPQPDPRVVVVRPGDSLWRIAARSLPEDADAAAVDRCWRRIYRANRDLIGPDPDRIRPGQRLRLPPPRPSR